MAHGYTRTPAQAPVDATYLTNTPNATLTAEQALSALASGYMKVTTGSGFVTSQPAPIPIADGGTAQTTFTLNGVVFKAATPLDSTAAGAATTVLRGNTGAAPSFSQVALASMVTGVLPIANGGTNAAAFTAGSLIFMGASALSQDNANFFWLDASDALLLGGTSLAAADVVLQADGQAIFNEQSGNRVFRVETDTLTDAFRLTAAPNDAIFFGDSSGLWAEFNVSTPTIVLNQTAANLDFRVEGQTQPNLLFTDASTDRIGVRTNAPHSTLDVRGGLNLITTVTSVNLTVTDEHFHILGNAEPSVAGITVTLPSAAATNTGILVCVTKTNPTAAKTVTIAAAAGQTFESGLAVIVIATQWTSRTLMSRGGGIPAWLTVFSKGAL